MVRVDNIETSYGNVQKVNLFADNRSDISAVNIETGETDMDIIGMVPNVKLTMGSVVLTAEGEVAFLKSDGTWQWQ